MGPIYRLTLSQMAGRWRLLIMTLLAALPVSLSVFLLRLREAPSVSDFELVVLSTLLAGSITPLVVLAIGAPAFANEIEDKTLANLVLTPIARSRIAVSKYLATLTITTPFIALSAFLTSYIAFHGDTAAITAVTVAAVIGVAMYASAFVWLGLVTTQAIGVGLVFVVLWEGLFSGFVSGVRVLSIRYLSIALMHGIDERRFAAANHVNMGIAVGTAALVVAGFLWLSVRRLRRMDVP